MVLSTAVIFKAHRLSTYVTPQIIFSVCSKACRGDRLSVLRCPIETHLKEFTTLIVLSCFLHLKVGLFVVVYRKNILTNIYLFVLMLFFTFSG